MCSTDVLSVVDGELRRAPRLGRRTLLGAAAASVLAVAAPSTRARAETPAASRRVVDLTYVLHAEFPVWPGTPPFVSIPKPTVGESVFQVNVVAYVEHSGTHIDAPRHASPTGITVEKIPASNLVVPLAVVDISAKAKASADAAVDIDDIEAWESVHGRLPDRAFVALHSGWQERLGTPGAFVNLGVDGAPHAPGFSAAAAEFLVTQRSVVGVGSDTLSIDVAADARCPAHVTVLGSGRYAVEALANLASVPSAGATVVVGAPTHAGGTGGPCRVLALVDEPA